MQRSSKVIVVWIAVGIVVGTLGLGCSTADLAVGTVEKSIAGSADVVVHTPQAPLFQSEPAIAANADGTILVAGYNDGRGLAEDPVSLAGIARSTDGGASWAEVAPPPADPEDPPELGVLPPGTGARLLGSPDVAFNSATGRFIYAAVYQRAGDSRVGIALFQSNSGADAGMTWSGAIEVTPSFVASSAASSPSIDIDPSVGSDGRVIVTWIATAGTTTTVESSFSDDLSVAWPGGAAVTIATQTAPNAVTRPDVAVAPTSGDMYSVWTLLVGANGRRPACSRSTDGGATWSGPVGLEAADLPAEDQVPGIGRAETTASVAINDSDNRVYVAYRRNDANGGGDVAVQTFTGACANGTPIVLSSNPGMDGPQFQPSVAVDQSSGTAYVTFLDQDIANGDDLTEAMATASTDSGATWRAPAPILDRPFRAGFGRVQGSPDHLGGRHQCIAADGTLHCAVAATSPGSGVGAAAAALFSGADVNYDRRPESLAPVPLRATRVCVPVGDGECDEALAQTLTPGRSYDLLITLENYVVNAAVGAKTLTGGAGEGATITATLSSNTPGVTVSAADSTYDDLDAGATGASKSAFTISLGRTNTILDQVVDLSLAVTAGEGTVDVPILLRTASVSNAVVLFEEDFEEGTDAMLPPGWTSATGDAEGVVIDPWIVDGTFSGSRAAFHDNNNGNAQHVILDSPAITLPANNKANLIIEFDIKYMLQDNPTRVVEAADGMTLTIVDKSGDEERRVLLESVARVITTGTANYFPRRIPLRALTGYLDGVSVWSGDSAGVVLVRAVVPMAGLAGSDVSLRFEYTQDDSGDCIDSGYIGPCGVSVDNIRVSQLSLNVASDLALSTAPLAIQVDDDDRPTFGMTVQNRGPNDAEGIVVTAPLPSGAALIAAFGDGFACTEAEGTVTCALDALTTGASTAVVLEYEPPAGATTALSSEAVLTAATFDPDTSNNTVGLQVEFGSSGCSCQVGTQRPVPTALGLILFAALACVRWRARRRRRE